ncbi:MAG: DNA double-strand break repair nuclease NurA [Nitrososphaera sp.]
MLREVYIDALKNREQKISKVKDSSYEAILAEAATRWIQYKPSPVACKSAGVDSSWNKRAYQGLNLYAVDAIAASGANEILASDYKVEIANSARREFLETMGMNMEASVAQKAAETGKTDIICVDGSIVARLKRADPVSAMNAAKKYGNSILVAKSSESRTQFSQIGSRAGDIYYYDRASRSSAGYSTPAEINTAYGRVTEIYARLRESTPILRLEVLRNISDQEIRGLLNSISYHSVSGYPYCLKLAHDACKISDEDIDRIASILSLRNENGARDALNE